MSDTKKPHPLCLKLAFVGCGYYGAHIRGRTEGLADHLDEAKKLVKQAVKEGLTFEMLEEEFRTFSKGLYNYNEDEYAQKLKQLFTEELDMPKKEFEVIYMNKGEPVTSKKLVGQMKPVRLAILPEGTLDNKPSLCFIMEDAEGRQYAAQLSDKMLVDGLIGAKGPKINLKSLNTDHRGTHDKHDAE